MTTREEMNEEMIEDMARAAFSAWLSVGTEGAAARAVEEEYGRPPTPEEMIAAIQRTRELKGEH